MLDFRILGTLHVLDDDREIELGGARQRAVLAILLLHAGETVSVDRIVDLMWGERPPATAVKTVQVYVSHLRRALVDDVLVSSKGGYALEVESERVDALRFERLVDEGRAALSAGTPERAAELLRAGLALWRGPPLADLAFEGFVQDAAARLEEQRLEALELRIEADLRLRRHAEVVAELEGLVREYPVREHLRAQHMLALYRSGRQAEALESFRNARRALLDELGLEPGRELRELEQAVLEQDPALDQPRTGGGAPPRVARRRGLVLIAAGAALAAAAATVAVALSRSSTDIAVLPNSVAVIDPESDLVVADVPVGVRPGEIAADDRSVWVANVGDDTVMQVDMRKRRVVATITPNVDVDALAVGAGSAWIADVRRGRAVRVDGLGAVANSVPLPTSHTTGLQFGTRRAALVSGSSLWVASSPLAAVLRIDTKKQRVTGRVDVGNDPAGLALAGGAIWVADGMDNTVDRIVPTDTGAGGVSDTIPLGNGPGPIAAGESAVWVANTGDGTVARIDPATRSVKAEIPVGRQPTGIAVGADAVWVANSLSGTVSRIDPGKNRVTKTIDVGGAPHSVTVAGGRVWVSVQEAPPRPAPSGGPSTVRMLLEHDPVATDPLWLDNAQLEYVSCGRLMTYDGRAAEIVPQLAAAPPEVSADQRVYTFRIRSGYRFSPPSGRPVTAAAFERTIERSLPLLDDVVGAVAYQAGRADRITGVSAHGNRLTVRLTRPSRTLVARLATFYACAVPPDTPARPRGLERIATAGRYYVATVTPGRRIVLRRNPGYPGPGARRPAAIEVTIGTTSARAVAEVEAGRADFISEVPLRAQARLIARYGPGSSATQAGRQQYFSGPSPSVSGFVFNPRRPLFARAEMRRAVNYAIDRRALAQHPVPAALAGRPTDQLLPPGWPGYRDAAIYPLGGPNLAAARRLAGAGHHRGILYTCNQSECVAQAEIVRENLAAIGIELEIRRFSFGNMFARLQNADEPYDISESGLLGEIPDPSAFVNDFFDFHGSTAFLNRTPQVRDAGRLTGAQRLEAYATLDRDIAAQETPFAMAVSNARTDFFSARIGCQAEHPIYGIDLAALCVRE